MTRTQAETEETSKGRLIRTIHFEVMDSEESLRWIVCDLLTIGTDGKTAAPIVLHLLAHHIAGFMQQVFLAVINIH